MKSNRLRPFIAGILVSFVPLFSASFAQEAVSVRVAKPTKTTLKRSTTQPATLHPFQEADLGSRVTGYVKSVAVDIGHNVEANAPLAEIDAPEMAVQHERKLAEVNFLTFTQAQLQAGTAVAEAQAKADKLEFDRFDKLAESGSVTQKARDESQRRMEASKAGLAVVEAEVKAAGASVVVAQMETKELKAMMDFATLRAPFKGVVTMRDVDPGDLVKSAGAADGHGPLFKVADLSTLRVRVAVPERDAVWVDVGDPAEFRCRSLAGVFEGKVARSSRSIDVQTGSMLVEIDLDNSKGTLIPGMFGEATIHLEEHENALVLPAGSVRFDESGTTATVYVISEGKAKVIEVKTGLDDGNWIEIISGLTGEEEVAAGLLGRLADGAPVKVIADSN
ncbi:MAG: HlyD family secretion protein [Verrucomicrobiales bacterium]|jgi:HlyD family secretion protein